MIAILTSRRERQLVAKGRATVSSRPPSLIGPTPTEWTIRTITRSKSAAGQAAKMSRSFLGAIWTTKMCHKLPTLSMKRCRHLLMLGKGLKSLKRRQHLIRRSIRLKMFQSFKIPKTETARETPNRLRNPRSSPCSRSLRSSLSCL
jgi:hypothetical protein